MMVERQFLGDEQVMRDNFSWLILIRSWRELLAHWLSFRVHVATMPVVWGFPALSKVRNEFLLLISHLVDGILQSQPE